MEINQIENRPITKSRKTPKKEKIINRTIENILILIICLLTHNQFHITNPILQNKTCYIKVVTK